MSGVRIIIVGAGVSGLALAQGLRRRKIDFAVYERDALLDSRLQGYRIKIVGEMAGKIRDLLTDEAWGELQATSAQTNLGETTLNATDAAIVASRRGRLPNGAAMPYTVDRGMLRASMMKGIEDYVYFGKKFSRYEVSDSGVSVWFEDGRVEHGTLLVGADGSHSLVRKQMLPDLKPLDTESCCIYGKSYLGPELLKRFPQEHRRWITVIQDKTPTLQNIISGDAPIVVVSEPVHFTNRSTRSDLPPDYIHWGILFHRDTLGLSREELSEALRSRPIDLSLELASEWHPSVRSLIELQEKSLTSGISVFSASPEMEAWKPSASVTAMGDSIHVMSPSGGVGAVAALNDAWALAKIISEEGISVGSIGKFEAMMRGFANVCIHRSFVAGDKMLNLPPFSKCKVADDW